MQSGRPIASRAPSELDVERMCCKSVSRSGTVPEINAHPSRLDLCAIFMPNGPLNWAVKSRINSDAHEVDGMDVMPYGVATARRLWVTAADVVNAQPLNKMLALLKGNR
ncbi:MAG: hypothetical protein R2867_42010 [Caldilineaceae bacterium]